LPDRTPDANIMKFGEQPCMMTQSICTSPASTSAIALFCGAHHRLVRNLSQRVPHVRDLQRTIRSERGVWGITAAQDRLVLRWQTARCHGAE
jgi:hypothetical protein